MALVFCSAGPVQAVTYPISSYQRLHGEIVRDVYQDARGFVWLATDSGVRRWSGTEFRRISEGYPAGAAARCLVEDGRGNLWVGTTDGLVSIDIETLEVRTRFEFGNGVEVRSVLLHSDGTLWFGTNVGLHRIVRAEDADQAERIELLEDTRAYIVQSLADGGDGDLWMGTYGALIHVMYADTESAIRLAQPLADVLGDRTVEALHRASDGALWIGLRHMGGLYRLMDGEVTQFGAADGLANDAVNEIVEDAAGDIWIGTEDGVFWRDGDRFKAIDRQSGLLCTDVHGLFVDRDQQIWIGTYGGGVHRLRSPYVTVFGAQDGLPHPMVTALANGPGGGLLVGTVFNGVMFDPQDLSKTKPTPLLHAELVHVTPSGEVWQAGPKGVTVDNKGIEHLRVGRIRSIASDETGRVYLGTQNGRLYRVDGPDHAVSPMELPPGSRGAVGALAFATDGSLLVGTSEGLFRRRNGVWETLLVDRDVRALLEEPDGRLWIGTARGLISWSDGVLQERGPSHLNTTAVRALVREEDGTIWAATPDGLLRWRDHRLVRVTYQDGLPSQDVRCLAIDDNGLLFAGTTHGLARIDTGRFEACSAAPRVVIERFIAGGQQWPAARGPAELPYAKRDVLIQVQTLGWRSNVGMRYEFRISGPEGSSTVATSERLQRYSKLPAGRYTVSVRGINAQGVESDKEAALTFTVLPPMWRELWVVTLAGVVLFLLVGLGISLYFRLYPVGRRTIAGVVLVSLLGGVLTAMFDVQEWWYQHTRALEAWELDDFVFFTPLFVGLGLVWAFSKAAHAAQRELSLRQRTEMALRTSRERFRSLCAAAPIGIFLTNAEGATVYTNEYLQRASGLSQEECLGVGWMKRIHADYREAVGEQVTRAARQGKPFHGMFRLCTPSGKVRWVDVQTALMVGERGELVGKVGTVRDITQGKSTEEALRDSEAQFRQLAENIRGVFWLMDLHPPKLVYVSPSYETMWGRSCAGILENPNDWIDGIHPEDREHIAKEFAKMIAEGKLFEGEYRVVRPDGSVIWVHDRRFPILDEAGHAYRMSGIAEDVTQRRRDREALRESERYNRTLFDATSIGLALCRIYGTLVDVNPAYARIIGRTVEETLKLSYWDITPSKYGEQELRQLDQLERTGRYGPYEKEYVHRSGRLVPVRLSGRILERNGERFIWSSVEDITERCQAEEEARLHQEELIHVARLSTMGEMASGLAHEINQPLSAIMNYAQGCLRRMRAGGSDLGKLYGAIEQISAQARRAGVIVRRLREFVRKETPQRAFTDINAIVRDAAAFAEPEAKQANVSITLQLADALPQVWADTIQIEQVILNLVRNAVDAMRGADIKRRELTIETAANGVDAVTVSVRDTGESMTPEMLERAFEPFFTTKEQGMGMGLPISRSLVEAHQGRLSAAPNDDRGMTFQFTLRTTGGGMHD